MILSWETQNNENNDKYDKLNNEYIEFKSKQQKEKEELLEEQNIIISSLQTQFELYRNTAEYIFSNEVNRLKDIIDCQMKKYELEIMNLCNKKEYNYEKLIQSKDSKIMNLIEGTDIQTIILKYESEMNDIKTQCREETNRIIDNIQRNHSVEISKLNNSILSQQDIISNMKDQITNLNVFISIYIENTK